MLARVFALLGCRRPDQIMDFVMTGATALPIMFFLGGLETEAAVTMMFSIIAIIFASVWTHALEEIEAAKDAEREELRKKISGGDR